MQVVCFHVGRQFSMGPHGSACLAREIQSALILLCVGTILGQKDSVWLWSKGQVCFQPWDMDMGSPLEQKADILTAHH